MITARLEQAAELMRREGYAALLVRLPEHVVMLTGYQPVLGNSFCLVSLARGGAVEVRMAVPGPEAERASDTQPTQMETYAEETLSWIGDTISGAHDPLKKLLAAADIPTDGDIGVEGVRLPMATGYTQVGAPAFATIELLRELAPRATFRDASSLLAEVEAIKTEEDLERIRGAERAAIAGFHAARQATRPGVTEADVAADVYAALVRAGYQEDGVWNVQPFVHVMAGRRSSLAYLAWNMTSNAMIQAGEPVLVQLEVGLNGHWAELTRVFFPGSMPEIWRNAHMACGRAQDAALSQIRAGAAAKAVDAAARQVMEKAGFGEAFKHGTGHGFGFQAINHGAHPILHPASQDILQAGMTHNLEPSVSLHDMGGVRLNDDVAVTSAGFELLSKELPRDLEWLITQG